MCATSYRLPTICVLHGSLQGSLIVTFFTFELIFVMSIYAIFCDSFDHLL